MTGALTPYGESLILSLGSVKGRISIDWKNMHGDYQRFGGRVLERELRRIAYFLMSIFDNQRVAVTYISGDTFVISSTHLTDEQLLNILRAYQESLESLGHLVCVAGFPDELTAEVFDYWQQHPENRFNRVELASQSVCVIDIRHLRKITEEGTMEVIEPLLTNFLGQLQASFFQDKVFRTRCDEFWIFSEKQPSQLAQFMERFASDYAGPLEFDWGLGLNLDAADTDLTKKKSKLEPAIRVQDPNKDLHTFHRP
ncbi:MAG: hypothetical protein PVJ09_00345 [Candidatus Woesebacteria bacterium]|jgi:GGDEF domain-containing protein